MVCVCIALGVDAAVRSRKILRTAVVVALVTMCVLWTRQLLLAQGDWIEAGRIAAAVQDQAVQVMPDPPQDARLHFVGVPLGVGVAYVYITYFDLAIRQAYGRDDVIASIDPDPDGPCRLPDGSQPTTCLRWNAAGRSMAEVRCP